MRNDEARSRRADLTRGFTRGFTLLEILVAITVLGVLIAILIPVLASAKRTAAHTQSMSNLKQLSIVFSTYADMYEGYYPVANRHDKYPWGCDGITIQFGHWSAIMSWPTIVHREAPWDEYFDVMHSPGSSASLDDRSCGHPPSYDYSASFLGDPVLWSGELEQGEVTKDMLRGMRRIKVEHPSRKVILWDREMPYHRQPLETKGVDIAMPTPMLFADSHTAMNVPAEATDPVPLPGGAQSADWTRQRLHNTKDGVRGWDY